MAFCPNCGTKLGSIGNDSAETVTAKENSGSIALREFIVSPLFFILLVAFIVNTLCRGYFTIAFLGTSLDLPLMLLLLIALVVSVCLLMLYIRMCTHPDGRIPPDSLLIIRITQYVYMGLLIIGWIYVFVQLISLYFEFSNSVVGLNQITYSYNSASISQVQTLFRIAFFVAAVLAVVSVVFHVQIIRSLGSVIRTVKTGWPSERISVFAAVICFAIALVLFLLLVNPYAMFNPLYSILGLDQFAAPCAGLPEVLAQMVKENLFIGNLSGKVSVILTVMMLADIVYNVILGSLILGYRSKSAACYN